MQICDECKQVMKPSVSAFIWKGRHVCRPCHLRLLTSTTLAEASTVSFKSLDYASPPAPGKRPKWVWAVVGLYLAAILAIAALPELAAWSESGSDATRTFCMTGIAVCVFFAIGGSLIAIPVRARRNRPISRRSVWIPIAGSALLFAALFAATGFGTMEWLSRDMAKYTKLLLAGTVIVWLAWMAIFVFLAFSLDPISVNSRLYKSLFVGSVLELLIAVPMHLVVRRRTECCAGMVTGMAICVGALVAIAALGPGVLFLYHRRWKETYGDGRKST